MGNHIEDLKDAIVGGLVHELEKIVTKNKDDIKAIETNRPGAINIGNGANWIAPHPGGKQVLVGGSPLEPHEKWLVDAYSRDAESLEGVIEEVKTGALASNKNTMAMARNHRNKISEELDVIMAEYKKVPVDDRTAEGLHESRLPFRIAAIITRLADAEKVIFLIRGYDRFHDEAGDSHPQGKDAA